MQHSKKIAFYTLGCKLNFAETSSIARTCEDAGYAKVDWMENPDIFVLNTCSVTENADKKCRKLVEQVRSHSPDVKVVVIGCYAQLKPENISRITGVKLVLGAEEKFNLPNYIDSLDFEGDTVVKNSPIKDIRTFIPSHSAGDRTRSFLKVQDGCDYFCSFCTIPLARGRSRSGSIEESATEAKKIANKGIKEIVISGVNIGDFGKGSTENFYELIKELDKVEGINRFRISSIEPNLLTNEIIDFVSTSQKFLPHFHIPLQSGSDKILQSMRRRYGSELYTDRINRINTLMPDCCIGVDVIVGYPGETEEDFEVTYNYLKDLDVSYLHVFTYSERQNTVAVRNSEVVPLVVRKERSKRLRILSTKKKRAFYESQLGKTKTVLWESEADGMIHGFTENYVKVIKPYQDGAENSLEEVQLTAIDPDGMVKVTPNSKDFSSFETELSALH